MQVAEIIQTLIVYIVFCLVRDGLGIVVVSGRVVVTLGERLI